MIQEFEYLREIERSLYGGLGFIPERETDTTHSRIWCDLYGNNRYESDLDRFLATKIAEYRNTIAAMDRNDLRAQNGLRGKELQHFFQIVQRERSQSCSPVYRKDERHFKTAFQVLTLGFISATAWEYMKPERSMDVNGFLAPFLSAGLKIEEVAQSVERQGVTDSETFLQLISDRVGSHATPSRPHPKDAIINNSIAVSLLNKMKDVGLLDAAYQWIGSPSHYEMAAFAKLIAEHARIGRMWASSFADLWPTVKARQLTRGLSEGEHFDFKGEAQKKLGLTNT